MSKCLKGKKGQQGSRLGVIHLVIFSEMALTGSTACYICSVPSCGTISLIVFFFLTFNVQYEIQLSSLTHQVKGQSQD